VSGPRPLGSRPRRLNGVPRPILVHGSGGDHRVWALQTSRLGGSVAIDLPGHPDGDPLTRLDDLAEALATAAATIDGPRALVGHSLGGAVALELARTRPELVDGLVVLASGARLPVPDAVMERAAADPPAERERLMAGFVADPAAAGARGVRAALEACRPATLAADYAACRTVDLRESLTAIGVPVLVIAGADDPLVPPWLSEELARALPMARMVVIAGARHVPMADAAGTVNLLLAAYLARLELTLADR